MAAMRHDFPALNPDGMIAVRYYEPPSDLIEMVGSIYLVTANLPHVSDHVRADFAQLRFNLPGRGHYIFRDGRQMESPRKSICGATCSFAPFTGKSKKRGG